MAVNTVIIPSMLNGVSTQAAQLRLATQGDEMVNGYATLQKGLGKRPPSVFIKQLDVLGDMDPRANVHLIDRDDNEKYVVVLTGGPTDRDLRVFDLEGNEQTVNFPDGKDYIDNGNPRDLLKLVTVADHTFVLNTQKEVSMSGETSPVRDPEALVHVLQGNYSHTYSIKIGGSRVASYLTPDGGQADHAGYIGTHVIARALLKLLQTPVGETENLLNSDVPTGDGGTARYNMADPASAEFHSGSGDVYFFGEGIYDTSPWSSTRYGSALHITRDDGVEFNLTAEDDFNNNAMKAIQKTTQRFSNLPIDAPSGYVVEVTGESSNGFDNYWVRFHGVDRVWKETVAPGIQRSFDPATMPHVLVRESDGTFTFRQAEWSPRTVGDNNSNPLPSFVGRKINDIAFHRNRLVLLAGEHVIMSRHGEYFNFWRETVTTILDTDPIDAGISTRKVAVLNHALPLNEDLFLVSSQAQLRLSSGSDLMSPRTAAIHPMSNYLADPTSVPLVLDDKVYFAANMGNDYSLVQEMWIEEDIRTHRQLNTTSHCPGYVQPDIYRMIGSSENEILFALHLADRARMDVYKFHWTDSGDKPQSAWSHWTMPGMIYGGDVVQNDLILLMNYNGSVNLIAVPLEVGRTEEGADFTLHLDSRVVSDHPDMTVAYAPVGDYTSYDLPFLLTSEDQDRVEVWTAPGGAASPGLKVPIKEVLENSGVTQVRLDGDWVDQPVYIGLPYAFLWRFSPVYIRDERQTGATDIIQERQQVQRLLVAYGDTAAFTVDVTPTAKSKRTYGYGFYDHANDDPDFQFDTVVLADGAVTVPILARNTEVDIELKNDTALPCWFINAEVRVLYQQKFKRL